jgi:hypothetical protein
MQLLDVLITRNSFHRIDQIVSPFRNPGVRNRSIRRCTRGCCACSGTNCGSSCLGIRFRHSSTARRRKCTKPPRGSPTFRGCTRTPF